MKIHRLGAALSAPLLAATLLLGGSSAVASQATPAAGSSAGGNYPVGIHQGTCEMPTPQPAYQLDNTTPVGADQTDATVLGQPTGVPVLTSSGTVDATLDDVGNGGNVLAIHASPDDYNTIVACGQIAGPVIDDQLTIALQPVGGSTVTGIATLGKDNSGVLGLGEDQIKVTVYIIETAANSPAQPTIATPIAPANAPAPTETPVPPTPAPTATAAPVEVTTTPQTVEVTPTPGA